MAYSASLLAPYATTPQAIAARTDREARRVTWTIDKARGVARLDPADVQPGGIELPLRPMLGCVGVAPPRKEAISTATPGNFGGNMDYAWLNPGVKVMLPVYEPGALLFIGDEATPEGRRRRVARGRARNVDGRGVHCPAREERGDGLAANRTETHPRARERASTASKPSDRDRGAAALADGGLREYRERRHRRSGPGQRYEIANVGIRLHRWRRSANDAARVDDRNGRTYRWRNGRW